MPTVVFCLSDGTEKSIEVSNGTSVMQAALSGGINEIVAECGGALACATCHVYVEPEYIDLLDAVDPQEDEMLDFAAAAKTDKSRLSCQIIMSEKLDSIRVHPADPQI